MHDRPIACFMVDILIFIDHVKQYTKYIHSVDDFESASAEKHDAIMRKLEILGEALKYILVDDNLQGLCQPRWRQIVNFRNVLAHGYFGIDVNEVFDVIKIHLLVFEEEYLVFLEQAKMTVGLQEAFEDALQKIMTKKVPLGAEYLTQVQKKLF